ncbi:hypothetical protein QYH69_32315 [Paraburkholderia sp. SARCC-3016]|uniref:hypothetical protein n=1 Tax=Paraburkholderia sp. SARCC-3016 TaxID=3058611 RepID=UPI00280915A9|nr:hypothetical protein [Paraburkholderia sp. SARCC-3016]MDQ7981909.1 hypothetical protein [Paraburkholderia sp. SARCC-3016]
MTLVHIASGITPQPSQSYVIDDFGDLCQLCTPADDDHTVAASRFAVSGGTMLHAMRDLGE